MSALPLVCDYAVPILNFPDTGNPFVWNFVEANLLSWLFKVFVDDVL